MNSETKQCQNCKQTFVIEPEDFQFYEQVKVPPPTFCSRCRWQNQLLFRNERTLYKRKCDAPGHNEELISVYSPDSLVKVYDQKYWWSDNWDSLEFGKAVDFSIPFLGQFGELIRRVPWPNLISTNPVNSEYCNSTLNLKNCYLIFAALDLENCAYGANIDFTKDSFDLKTVVRSELCYELTASRECYKVIFSAFCDQCSDSAFLWDCRGCSYCFGCVGLRNKSYHIFNKPYSKEEYRKKIKEFDFGDFKTVEEFKRKFIEFRLSHPNRYARIFHSTNAVGDELEHVKNCYYCFDSYGKGVEDSRYM